ETALAVLNSFDSYDSSQAFQGWAIGIARNQIGLYLRRRRRDRLVFSEETIANLQTVFDESSPPDELDHLPTCIDQLAGRARKICDLRYQKGLKPAAISEQIGMTANSVAKALQRIREQLRECIEDKFVSEGANG
ncbi:MAG: sigma-70 family RNA polymerase sigma factor, partial [Rhodopirellula bahusiensis]